MTRAVEGTATIRPWVDYPAVMPSPRAASSKFVQPSQVSLDEIDYLILRELEADARIPNNTLAERAGVAPSTCSLRLRRLKEVGAIRGFHADLAPEILGRPLQAMISVRVQ